MKSRISNCSASIIVQASNRWSDTRECLESLRPTLRSADQVLVVDNGTTDRTGELAKYPWAKLLLNPVKGGFAEGRNLAAGSASEDVLVFLSGDTIVFDGWLDDLLAPFVDNEVAAVGPRSNNVAGEQLIQEIPYKSYEPDSQREFAQAWRRAHVGQITETGRLGGFCLAVRSQALKEVGGFDAGYETEEFVDDDLSMKLRTKGRRLLIAHGCFVHRVPNSGNSLTEVERGSEEQSDQDRFRSKWGTEHVVPVCLVSACLIVKDEERMLQSCLDSISGVVDEIIVYDTGSIDRTIEIARAAGAKVIEGYWDDSFSRARNAALENATGEWVLSLDADENLLADPVSLRRQLADRRSELEAYLVAIENLHGAGKSRSVHTAIRLFRRKSGTWRHRLHEQVVATDDPARPFRVGYLSGARIIHYGYLAEVFESRKKAERNLALAKTALEDDEVSRPYALMNYGRALESAGCAEDAVDALLEAASITEDQITQRLARNNLIYILGRLGRFEDALEQVEELRRISVSQVAADIAEGRTRIAMGDAEGGLALLARVPPRGRDDDGMEYAAHMLAAVRGEALASLGRFSEAADVVLEAVRSDGVLEADLGELMLWLTKAGRSLSDIVNALSVDDLIPVLGRVLRQPRVLADALLEGIWTRFPDRLEPLAAAGRIGPWLPVVRALVWSSRLRKAGLDGACPLVAMAKNEDIDPRLRILAGAAAFGSFADGSVVKAVHEARSRLDPVALEESTQEIGRIAPGLLEASHVDAMVPPVTTPLVRSSMVGRGRQIFLQKPAIKVAPVVHRGGVNIVGAFESTSVEGYIARSFTTTLRSHGFSVSTTSYHSDGRGGPVKWTHRDDRNLPYDVTLMALAPKDLSSLVIENGAAAFEGRYIVGIWAWDFEQPSEIMGVVGRMVHEIWVPSRFAAGAVGQITDRPVLRVPPPVVTYWPVDNARNRDRANSKFTFMTGVDYATGFERQNPLGAVEAFCSAFRPGEGPVLVIEATHSEQYVEEHRSLLDAVAGREDILVVDNFGRSPGRTLGKVGARSCYVSLHRSEGTGLMLARAMVQRIPIIVTGFGFSQEFQGAQDSFQIPFALAPIPDHELRCLPGGRWAEPNLERAARAMRLVVEKPKLVAATVQKARDRASRQFSPGGTARAVRNRLNAIEERRYGNVANSKQSARAGWVRV